MAPIIEGIFLKQRPSQAIQGLAGAGDANLASELQAKG